MLRTWSGMFIYKVDLIVLQLTKYQGLMYFCMDDMRAIRSLIDTLRIPSLEPRVRTAWMTY
jgi:rapamycin-insensitive companion of mTOR (Rictor)-like putative scaffolding protein